MRAFDEAERARLAHFLDLDALFAIDWTTLSWPGSAGEEEIAHFPYHLCNLTSPDPTLRDEAIWAINDLTQDLILSNLTTKSVPFLLQLVSHPDLPTLNSILDVLWSIAYASRYQIESKPHLSSYACIDPAEPDELILLQEVHQMIAGVLPMLIAFLTDKRTDILASHILSYFPEHVAEIWPTLVQTFLRVEDEGLKATVLECLAALAVGDPETCVPWLENVRLTHPSELVRFVATIQLPHVTKQNTSPVVVASLIELLETQPAHLRQQYAALNADNSHVFFSHSIYALRACEPTVRKTALPILLRLFAENITLPSSHPAPRPFRDVIVDLFTGRTTSPSSKVPMEAIAYALIEFAFPQENPENPILAVDREQQQILAVLCTYDPIWKRWRWDTHLQRYGLPGKREDVLALCDVSLNI